MSDFSARLTQVIDFIEETPNSFSIRLGYKRSQTLYDLVKGKVKPSYDFFHRFLNTEYSDIINIEWLIAEKGVMLKNLMQLDYVNEQKAGYLSDASCCQQCKIKDQLIEAQKKTISQMEWRIAHCENKK